MMKLIVDIWASFRRLPVWVQVWVALILVPVNMAALAFVGQPMGGWIAILAVGGMTPNLFFLLYERGFSKIMALSHLVLWTPLVMLIWAQLGASPTPAYAGFLWLLLVIDLISLVFDYPDAWRWWRGERAVA